MKKLNIANRGNYRNYCHRKYKRWRKLRENLRKWLMGTVDCETNDVRTPNSEPKVIKNTPKTSKINGKKIDRRIIEEKNTPPNEETQRKEKKIGKKTKKEREKIEKTAKKGEANGKKAGKVKRKENDALDDTIGLNSRNLEEKMAPIQTEAAEKSKQKEKKAEKMTGIRMENEVSNDLIGSTSRNLNGAESFVPLKNASKAEATPTVVINQPSDAQNSDKMNQKPAASSGTSKQDNEGPRESPLKLQEHVEECIQRVEHSIQVISSMDSELSAWKKYDLNVIKPMEPQPTRPIRRRTGLGLLPREIEYCLYMMETYGDNYEAMTKDARNIYMDDVSALARKIRIFRGSADYQEYVASRSATPQPQPLVS